MLLSLTLSKMVWIQKNRTKKLKLKTKDIETWKTKTQKNKNVVFKKKPVLNKLMTTVN